MKKTFVIALIIINAIIMILASDLSAMRRADAIRAAEILRPRMVIRRFCNSCGDTTWTHITIRKVKIRRRGYNYSLVINSDEIELENYYIKIHGNWVNIALLIGLDAKGAPEFLPSRARTP